MSEKLKFTGYGIVIGAIIAFPIGINFGRGESLFSNPFAKQQVKAQVKEKVSETGKVIVEEAREQIHKATEPVRNN